MSVLKRPRHRSLSELAVVLGHVRAPAVIEVARDRVVVVAVDRRNPTLLDQPTNLVRMRTVTDQVTAAVDRVDANRIDRLEAGLQRRQVAVDIRYHRYAIH